MIGKKERISFKTTKSRFMINAGHRKMQREADSGKNKEPDSGQIVIASATKGKSSFQGGASYQIVVCRNMTDSGKMVGLGQGE